MADKKKMSVEDILAACRRTDRPGNGDSSAPAAQPHSEGAAAVEGAAAAEASEAAATASAAVPGEQPPAKPAPASPSAEKPAAGPSAGKPAAGKKPGEMSVADILAAARAGKSASGAVSAEAGERAAEEAPAAKPAAPAKAAAPSKVAGASKAAGGAKPAATPAGAMSVADILAAARSGKGAAAATPASQAAVPAKDKPVPKAAPAKVAEKPAAAGAAATKDTTSILAAARKGAKPGPMSKAEAEAKGKPVEERGGKKKLEAPPMPPKPDYARPQAAAGKPQAAQPETRRSFFGAIAAVFVGSSLAVGFSSLAVTHLLWVLGLARFMFPNVLTEPPTRFKVGSPDDYPPGYVENKYKAQFGVWIVRTDYEGQPQIFALQTVCTHLGCTPNWLEGEQKFKCPCHGSGFYRDGVNFEGPAPRPLERFAIRLADDGQLEVDKSRKFQEELGQWKDPACYVTA